MASRRYIWGAFRLDKQLIMAGGRVFGYFLFHLFFCHLSLCVLCSRLLCADSFGSRTQEIARVEGLTEKHRKLNGMERTRDGRRMNKNPNSVYFHPPQLNLTYLIIQRYRIAIFSSFSPESNTFTTNFTSCCLLPQGPKFSRLFMAHPSPAQQSLTMYDEPQSAVPLLTRP